MRTIAGAILSWVKFAILFDFRCVRMNKSILFFHILQMHSTSCRSFKYSRDQACLQPCTPSLKESPLSELAELVPALFCSFVTTSYIVRAESAREDLSVNVDSPIQMVVRRIHFDFLKHVSPGLALGSCLVLGCCLSSFIHRRRELDQYQPIVFVIWITWAVFLGWEIGASANMVTLGIVPWASCAAILSSFFGHAGARRVSTGDKCDCANVFTVINEKEASFQL
ncbi:hypothetical protein GGS26DRAFT_58292 [Hypomontagnella submonticulosa]|nr:hypothetical protein GGS26DRAFT_58292 [Hypomontagnella submonticulosa]